MKNQIMIEIAEW